MNGLNPIANPLNVRDDDPTNIELDIGEINITEDECELEIQQLSYIKKFNS